MKTNFNLNSEKSFESQINTIFNSLSSTLSDSSVVVKERVRPGSLCKGLIAVFSRAELKRRTEEEKEYHILLRQGYRKEDLQKPFKATPSVKYAFYASNVEPERLGSIAIYGANLTPLLLMLNKSRILFGYRVISTSVEMGARPFLDVKLTA